MKQRDSNGRIRPRCCAFTIVELLALIAVVVVFAGLHLTAMAKAGRQTKIGQCASNLRQFAQATIVFAHENDNQLPSNNSAGFWAWDIAWAIGEQLGRYGAPWQTMYCPGTAPRITDSMNFQLYTYAPNSYRVIGYAATFPGTISLNPTNMNATLNPPPIQVSFGQFRTPLASERVLLADAIVSSPGQNQIPLQDTYNYTSISGGFPIPFGTPHLNGKLPSGGNLAMLDGHVEWRGFKNMAPRTDNGGSPTFWW